MLDGVVWWDTSIRGGGSEKERGKERKNRAALSDTNSFARDGVLFVGRAGYCHLLGALHHLVSVRLLSIGLSSLFKSV